MVHTETVSCVKKAEVLLEADDPDSLCYASLQLRMAIEHLFYELIPLYREELPDDIVNRWQPKQIIDALLDCDPHVDQDATVTFYSSTPNGGPGEPFFQRRVRAVTKRMLKQHYHKLGFYLNAPMHGRPPEPEKWRAALQTAVGVLKQYTSDQILCNVRPLVSFDCVCGRTVKRNIHAIEANTEVKCPDPSCGAIWDAERTEDGIFRFQIRRDSYRCPYCKETNFVPVHEVKDGITLICDACEGKVLVKSAYRLQTLDQTEPTSG